MIDGPSINEAMQQLVDAIEELRQALDSFRRTFNYTVVPLTVAVAVAVVVFGVLALVR